jgi:hypothetical protein
VCSAEDLGSFRDIWDWQSAEWARFVRTPGHDPSVGVNLPCLHRPLDAWFGPVTAAGLGIEVIREPVYPREEWTDETTGRWARIPLFLHVRACKR